MKIITRAFKQIDQDKPWVLSIGNFDGFHLGHQVLVSRVLEEKKLHHAYGGVLTFDPHPKKVLQPNIPFRHIYDLDTRCRFLAEADLDACFIIPFNKKFANLGPQEFLEKLVGQINLKKIIVGYDFNFGKARAGSAGMLDEFVHQKGIEFVQMPAVKLDDLTVSSTMIRRLLFEGDFDLVQKFLGRPWSVAGEVKEGNKLGHTIGFATLNLEPGVLLPLRTGVYLCRTKVGKEFFSGVCNIGYRPTFGGKVLKVEAHLFDFNRDIYGQWVEVQPIRFIREEKKFASIDELQAQIKKDVNQAKSFQL